MHRWGKTNLSHEGPNTAHVRYWRVNNPTLWGCCVSMIGRADIEASKSNVAINTWLPQASYPCGNFLTPRAEHFSDLKDRGAFNQQSQRDLSSTHSDYKTSLTHASTSGFLSFGGNKSRHRRIHEQPLHARPKLPACKNLKALCFHLQNHHDDVNTILIVSDNTV